MELGGLLVAAHNDVFAWCDGLARQLPGFSCIEHNTETIVTQVDVGAAWVVELHPGVGEVVQVVHPTINVRLHQLVDNQMVAAVVGFFVGQGRCVHRQHQGHACVSYFLAHFQARFIFSGAKVLRISETCKFNTILIIKAPLAGCL